MLSMAKMTFMTAIDISSDNGNFLDINEDGTTADKVVPNKSSLLRFSGVMGQSPSS